ncbi:MAG: UvrB/UvrC motif-containing protein [Candidatus Omnitrophota bacterium]
MFCDICGKDKATVHLTEIVDDQMTELHLCEGCAKKKSIEMEQQFGLADLLAGLTELGGQKADKDTLGLKCPVCHISYDDFRKVGRLGCSHCYDTFRKYLVPLLKKIHGSSQHLGKAPKMLYGVVKPSKIIREPRRESEIGVLKSQLQEAIKKENFEDAAKIRDRIRELEKKNGEGKK